MEEKDIINEEAQVTPTKTETPSEEKASTVELREAYEENSAQKTPKKKKISKKKLALIIVASVILLIGIAVGLFFLIGALLAEDIEIVQGEFHNTPPAVESTYSADELALIESAMEKNASADTIKQAIALIYTKANYNKIHNAPQAITVLQGYGGADALGAVGSMAVRGFKVQAGSEFYYQKAAPIVECDPVSLQKPLSDLLEQQERVYTNGVDDFRYTGTLKGPSARIDLDDEDHPMTKTIPFIPVKVPKKSAIKSAESKEAFYEIGYYLEDPREITNFNIKAEYIVLKELEDGEAYIEECQTEDGDHFYLCRFSMLIEGEGHDACVDKARAYLRKSANSTDLEYLQFDVTLEVWTNGFFKKMHDEEQWSGTVTAGAKSTSTSWYESITYYDFNAEIFTEEDAAEYEGDDWAAKIIAHYKAELDNA